MRALDVDKRSSELQLCDPGQAFTFLSLGYLICEMEMVWLPPLLMVFSAFIRVGDWIVMLVL